MTTPEKVLQDAVVIREFIAHPGMKLLIEKLNVKMENKRIEWLRAKTPEEAEILRQDGRSYALLMGTLNEFLLRAQQVEQLESQRKSNGTVQ
jgi:hypothetical protein